MAEVWYVVKGFFEVLKYFLENFNTDYGLIYFFVVSDNKLSFIRVYFKLIIGE